MKKAKIVKVAVSGECGEVEVFEGPEGDLKSVGIWTGVEREQVYIGKDNWPEIRKYIDEMFGYKGAK